MISLALIKIGTSTGTILPEEMLSRLKVEKGESLFAIETERGYMITPYDPTIESQLKAGREVMNEYRDTFQAIAK